MPRLFVHLRIWVALVIALFSIPQLLFAQGLLHKHFGPFNRPNVKLIGFFDPNLPKTEVRPTITLALPGQRGRYTFLLTDMRIMAGPARTPGSILSEVKPYPTNFYIRASVEEVQQLASATPNEQVTIFAQYISADRSLLVQSVEKSEDPYQY